MWYFSNYGDYIGTTGTTYADFKENLRLFVKEKTGNAINTGINEIKDFSNSETAQNIKSTCEDAAKYHYNFCKRNEIFSFNFFNFVMKISIIIILYFF